MSKKSMLGILFSLLIIPAFGQEKDLSKHVFSVQAGYGNLLRGSKFLTQSTDAYEQKLRDGVAWNASYYFNFIPEMGIGMLYAGHSSKADHSEGADHLLLQFVAPQFAVNFVNNRRATIGLHTGIGILSFRNYSEVFGKDRKVRAWAFGCNIGLKAEYKISRHWGIGADCQVIFADTPDAKINYFNDTHEVEQTNYLRPFSLTGGIYYHF